jgi:hypothetical protein
MVKKLMVKLIFTIAISSFLQNKNMCMYKVRLLESTVLGNVSRSHASSAVEQHVCHF